MRPWLLVIPAMLWGCASQPAHPPETRITARKVQAVTAQRTSRPLMTEVVGTVRAVRSATIAPVVGGTVAEVRITLGSSVREGDVLVRLSAREIDARLEQSKAVYALAKLERERATTLHSQDAISAAQYDAAQSQFRVAEARQAEASAMAGNTILRAPFSGVVTAKLVNVGDTAMPGQALLVLEAPGALRFEGRVPEAAASVLSARQTLPVRLDGLDREIEGRIAEIEPASEDLTRSRLVKLDLPHQAGVRSGQFGRLLLATGSSPGIAIPPQAVLHRGQLEVVFVAESGKARLRLVRTARERDGLLEVASGLSGDERVIVSAVSELTDGQLIEDAK
jgi:RND family efflux transporter MFP subunit